MIIRGTTPYHNFILPILVEDIKAIYVTYLQNNEVILDKQLSEEEKHCSQLTIHLTQEETLRFHFYPAAKKNIAVIHIRILTVDGEAYASEPVRERIFGTRREGVIGQEEEEEE